MTRLLVQLGLCVAISAGSSCGRPNNTTTTEATPSNGAASSGSIPAQPQSARMPPDGQPEPTSYVQLGIPAAGDHGSSAATISDAKRRLTLPIGFVRNDDGRIYCTKDGAEMVFITEGDFSMGASANSVKELSAAEVAAETPVHAVFLSAFLMDRFEVTIGQFMKFCLETERDLPDQPSDSDERHPVVNVTWRQARDYCAWAGRRLPTEAEWEKAAKGLDGRAYPWGDDAPTGRHANCSRAGLVGATQVGSFPADLSPYGCLDMAGNVSEWCADYYDSAYYARGPRRDPPGPTDGTTHVVRGGSWYGSLHYLRCASRMWADGFAANQGFRAAHSLP